MVELNESEFDEATAQGAVLVDFTAEWCAPCKVMLPVIERVARDFDERMRVYSVDIDRVPSLAARNGVMSVPTFLLFRDGSAVERIVGAVSERELRVRLERVLESPA